MAWGVIDRDPTAPAVKEYLRATLRGMKKGRVLDLDDFIKDFVSGQHTLDIGCVDHVARRASRHRKLASWADHVLGIDILDEGIQVMRTQGYNVRHADATSAIDLEERFTRIVAAEVIEHVDNPVAFLRFTPTICSPTGRRW